MLEQAPAMQAARLCDAALAAWAPTTVERYSKLLAEWQRFAEPCKGCWDCPPVGPVLQFADWLQESRRLAPSSIKVMLSGVVGAVAAAGGSFPLASPLVERVLRGYVAIQGRHV